MGATRGQYQINASNETFTERFPKHKLGAGN
jgi:hypothetical protein